MEQSATAMEAARHVRMAEGYFELGDSREALRTLDLMPAACQGYPRVVLLRALLLMSLEMWPEAEAVAITATKTPAASPLLWYSLAVAQAQQKKLVEARKSLKSAIDLNTSLREVALQDISLAGVL